MNTDNTQDGAEPSPASAGSHGDPLSVCCRHLANSQAIIERKNAEIERLRLTDEEKAAIALAKSRLGTSDGDWQADDVLAALLERLG